MGSKSGWIRSEFVWAGCLLAFLLAGCNDPSSERRIRIRTEHLNQTVSDIVRREQSGVQRLDEAEQTFKKWWKSDTERFQRHAATIGDYIW